MIQALDMLQSITGFVRAQSGGSADKPFLIGTIDPAYVQSGYPGTLPKVTFDGESTLSGKQYAVMSGYWPAAGDRVVLAPVGTTYMILGCVSGSADVYADNAKFTNLTVTGTFTGGSSIGSMHIDEAVGSTIQTCTGTLTDVTGASLTFNTSSSAAHAVVIWTCDFEVTSAATETGIGQMSYDGVDVPTRQALKDMRALSRATITQRDNIPLPTPGSHTFKLRAQRTGSLGTIRMNPDHTGFTLMLWDYP